MNVVIGVIVGLLVLMFLVTVHEFGHFLAARRNGVSVTEFGIGFPPRAIAWIKDPKTGKWRRLPKSEWTTDKATRVVYSETKETKEAKTKATEAGKKTKATEAGTKKEVEVIGVKERIKTSKRAEKRAELKRDGYFQRGMIFSLNWLPIGGFCQMDGESDAETRPGTFGSANFWSKTKILFAGVGMNWLVAIIILTILAWVGMPELVVNQFTLPVDSRVEWAPVRVGMVMEGSPAETAGFSEGDYVVAIDEKRIELADDIKSYDGEHAGEEVMFTVVRGADDKCMRKVDWGGDWQESLETICKGTGKVAEAKVKLNTADAEYLLGISMQEAEKKTFSTWSAPVIGVGLTAQLTGETFKGVGTMIGNLISGIGSQFSFDATVRENGQEAISEVGDSVSGPVGIIGVLFPAFAAAGPVSVAFLAALISVSLACMNVLPIPALDGGRWMLIAIYKLRKKKLTQEIEEKIVSRAFIVLLAIIFIVTVLDVMRIVR